MAALGLSDQGGRRDVVAEYQAKKERLEIEELQVAWEETSGNIAAMGRQLGLPRQTVQSRLKKYGLFKYSGK